MTMSKRFHKQRKSNTGGGSSLRGHKGYNSLSVQDKTQVDRVMEVKPDWSADEMVSFCSKYQFDESLIQEALANAFEFDKTTTEEWEEIKKPKKKSSYVRKSEGEYSTYSRGEGFAGRGRGGARGGRGASRGGRGGRGGARSGVVRRSRDETSELDSTPQEKDSSENDNSNSNDASSKKKGGKKQPAKPTEPAKPTYASILFAKQQEQEKELAEKKARQAAKKAKGQQQTQQQQQQQQQQTPASPQVEAQPEPVAVPEVKPVVPASTVWRQVVEGTKKPREEAARAAAEAEAKKQEEEAARQAAIELEQRRQQEEALREQERLAAEQAAAEQAAAEAAEQARIQKEQEELQKQQQAEQERIAAEKAAAEQAAKPTSFAAAVAGNQNTTPQSPAKTAQQQPQDAGQEQAVILPKGQEQAANFNILFGNFNGGAAAPQQKTDVQDSDNNAVKESNVDESQFQQNTQVAQQQAPTTNATANTQGGPQGQHQQFPAGHPQHQQQPYQQQPMHMQHQGPFPNQGYNYEYGGMPPNNMYNQEHMYYDQSGYDQYGNQYHNNNNNNNGNRRGSNRNKGYQNSSNNSNNNVNRNRKDNDVSNDDSTQGGSQGNNNNNNQGNNQNKQRRQNNQNKPYNQNKQRNNKYNNNGNGSNTPGYGQPYMPNYGYGYPHQPFMHAPYYPQQNQYGPPGFQGGRGGYFPSYPQPNYHNQPFPAHNSQQPAFGEDFAANPASPVPTGPVQGQPPMVPPSQTQPVASPPQDFGSYEPQAAPATQAVPPQPHQQQHYQQPYPTQNFSNWGGPESHGPTDTSVYGGYGNGAPQHDASASAVPSAGSGPSFFQQSHGYQQQQQQHPHQQQYSHQGESNWN